MVTYLGTSLGWHLYDLASVVSSLEETQNGGFLDHVGNLSCCLNTRKYFRKRYNTRVLSKLEDKCCVIRYILVFYLNSGFNERGELGFKGLTACLCLYVELSVGQGYRDECLEMRNIKTPILYIKDNKFYRMLDTIKR